MNQKNIYITLTVVGVVVLAGGLLWYFFSNKNPIVLIEKSEFNVNGVGDAENNIKGLSQGPVVSAHKSGDGVLFYDLSGQLWQIKKDSETAEKADQNPVENASEAEWSANFKNIVKAGIEQSDSQFFFSDFTSKTLSSLKAGVKSVVFSPDAKKIAYIVSDGKGNDSLFTSDSDGRNQRTVIGNLKLKDVDLSWPKANQLALISRPSGLVPGGLWILNVNNGTTTKLIDNLFGLETVWSPDGESFIYSYADQNGRNPKLALYDKKGATKTFDNIPTIADKCSWAEDSTHIYCAVPESWPESAVIPDDYYKKTFSTRDEIWKINIETESKNIISSKLTGIHNIAADENQDRLFFISRENQILYRLKGIK